MTVRLESGDAGAERREAIVAATLIVELRHRATLGQLDQPIGDEPLEHAVQVAGLEQEQEFDGAKE
jgi:hypothetical protein